MTAAPDLLTAIVASTRRDLEVRREQRSYADLEREVASTSRRPQGAAFAARLARRDTVNVIAECKRRSPSKGLLKADYDPAAQATAYARGGAAAISVLTEPAFFDGSLDHLAAVRAAVDVPLLRKDFIVDDYQLLDAVAHGADAVLLIVCVLDSATLGRLHRVATARGVAVLVEVHDEAELERAIAAGATIVGVNNRNLRTLEVDSGTSARLAPRIPAHVLAVSESGLSSRDEVARLRDLGYTAFLVGERLMTSTDPERDLRALCARPEPPR